LVEKNGSKILSRMDLGIPVPVSLTSIANIVPGAFDAAGYGVGNA